MRRTIGLFTAMTLILITATPALGKGPASATVTGPGIDEPIELFDQRVHDPAKGELISELAAQTGIWLATPTLDRIERPSRLGPGLTLSWVNMGPPEKTEAERTIRQVIYLRADGGPVIHTPESQPALEGWGGDVTGWFRAPAELEATLQASGVPTDAAGSAWSTPSALTLSLMSAIVVLAIIRLVNSRLRPVVPYP